VSPRTVIAKITSKPGQRDDAVRAFAPLVEAAACEPGTLTYRMYFDRKDESIIWFFEEYADKVALESHMASDVMRAVSAAVAEYLAAPPDMAFVQPALPGS
jgi:quinol monooxygenase YgiN